MMSTPPASRVAVVTIWAEDVPATAAFYREVIGLQQHPPMHEGDPRPHLKLDGGYLVILHGQPCPAANAHPEHFPLFALTVPDLDTAVERLKTHNVELPWGVQSHGPAQWVMFYDPAGNLIELVEH